MQCVSDIEAGGEEIVDNNVSLQNRSFGIQKKPLAGSDIFHYSNTFRLMVSIFETALKHRTAGQRHQHNYQQFYLYGVQI